MIHWPEGISQEMQYVALLFLLFVLPRILQRFRLPSAVSCVGLGVAAGMGLGLFQNDSTVNLLSTLGIVSLFLFAGLEVDAGELRRNASVITQHLFVRIALLALVTETVGRVFRLTIQPALLIALALTSPSAGFILDSLQSLEVNAEERTWIKSKAIATELVALGALFLALQPPRVDQVLLSTLTLVAMIAVLPFVFRLFAALVLPYAPKSEFAFLLIVGVLCAVITRQLGAYYLIGAFVVGVTAQRFRQQMPAIASENMVHAVEVFASFFVPFYFFHAGLGLRRDDLTLSAAALGLVLVLLFVPFRVALVAVHRRLALREPLRRGARIGIAMAPTLVFTFVLADILRERFALSSLLFGALIVYTLTNTLIPGFLLRLPAPMVEDLHAPLPLFPQPDATPVHDR